MGGRGAAMEAGFEVRDVKIVENKRLEVETRDAREACSINNRKAFS